MATKSQSQISSIDDVDTAQAVAEVQEAAVVKGANHDDNLSGQLELITIYSSSEDGGNDAVFVSHNGYAYQIPRDKPFKIPTEVAQGLRDAVVTHYRPGPNGTVKEESRPRYNFSSQPVAA